MRKRARCCFEDAPQRKRQTTAAQVVDGNPQSWARAAAALLPRQRHITIVTDCSGVEAPLEALRQVQAWHGSFDVKHLSSCEVDELPRRWIQWHNSPEKFFADMLDRSWRASGRGKSKLLNGKMARFPHSDCYVLGFPCTPFSSRHTDSMVWGEKATAPWWAGLTTIRNVRPRVVVLENVHGLLRRGCLDIVLEELKKIKGYFITYFSNLDPHTFGFPCSRPRVYIVMLRKDSTNTVTTDEDFRKLMLQKIDSVRSQCPKVDMDFMEWLKKYFPPVQRADKHEAVQHCRCSFDKVCKLHPCMRKHCKAGHERDLKCRWRSKGLEFLKKQGLTPRDVRGTYAACLLNAGVKQVSLLPTPRVRATWDALCAWAQTQGCPDILESSLVADVTQSVNDWSPL